MRLQQQWQWCRQPTVAMVGAGNGGRSGGSARADNNQPKKWHQRCSKYYFKCNILNITWLWRQEQGAAVCGCGDSFNGVDSQQRQCEGMQWWPKQRQCKGRQHSTKKRSNSSRNGASGGGDGGSHGSGSGSGIGDGGNGGDDAAAMAAVTAVPTWRRQWQRGRLMWAEVIFCKLLTIILFA